MGKKDANCSKGHNITEFMHRMLSNEEILYFYSGTKPVLHEKHCRYAREIPDEELKCLKEYDSNMEQCPECAAAAYLHIGAKDPEDVRQYLELFDKIRIPVSLVRHMYLDKQMRTRIRRDTIIVWYKEDTWKIRALSKKGRIQLYHNNYIVKETGVREFTGGFHIQNQRCKDTHISYALKPIENYEFKPEKADLHCNIA